MYNITRLYKGMSELLAIVIGIAITIVIGATFYLFIPNFMNTMSQQQRIGVTLISSASLNDGTAIVSLAIRNLGTKSVKEINITFINCNVKPLIPNNIHVYGFNNDYMYIDLGNKTLAPGQEFPVTVKLQGITSTITSGSEIGIIITAKFVDGSSTSLTSSITIA